MVNATKVRSYGVRAGVEIGDGVGSVAGGISSGIKFLQFRVCTFHNSDFLTI
jgi:hypothetical protein